LKVFIHLFYYRCSNSEDQDAGNEATADDFKDDEFEDDDELNSIREKRIQQMKNEMAKRQKFLNQNHGSYREIKEEDFLREVTSSDCVVVHFYHKEFTRCKIMDKHLEVLAKTHLETKFLSIDVEKAPFFVTKLQVKVLPAILLFRNGNVVDRIVGFDDLGGADTFKTETLAKRIALSGIMKN